MIEYARTAWFAFTFLRDVLLGPSQKPVIMSRARRFGLSMVIFLFCASLLINAYLIKEKLTHQCPTCPEMKRSLERMQQVCKNQDAPVPEVKPSQPHITSVCRRAAQPPASVSSAASGPSAPYSASDALKLLME